MIKAQLPLEQQTALITGASKGIGKAIALELAGLGAEVLLIARSEPELTRLREEIEVKGGKASSIVADIATADGLTLVTQVISDLKPAIMVNNAGITRDQLLLRMKDEQWDEVLNLNLRSAFILTRAAAKSMLKAKYGRIINITSVIGIRGNAGQSNYAAAKAGMIGFTKSVARELGARNITVNAVAPGYIDTEMTKSLAEEVKATILAQIPIGRMGKPEDISRMVAFLAHPNSDYITGQVFNVDGGML